MKRLRKFLSLTGGERLLLVKAVLLLAVIRVGLKLLPVNQLRGLLDKISQPRVKLQAVDEASVNKVAWAVTVASPYLRAVCLPQALATQVLLGRRGYPTQLCIGFTRSKGRRRMSAHAWVESEGRVMIGGDGNMVHYIRVPLQAIERNKKSQWYLFS